MALRTLSTRAREKYPNETDLIADGLVNEDELNILLCKNNVVDPDFNAVHIIPLKWAMKLAEKARSLDRISNDNAFKVILGMGLSINNVITLVKKSTNLAKLKLNFNPDLDSS